MSLLVRPIWNAVLGQGLADAGGPGAARHPMDQFAQAIDLDVRIEQASDLAEARSLLLRTEHTNDRWTTIDAEPTLVAPAAHHQWWPPRPPLPSAFAAHETYELPDHPPVDGARSSRCEALSFGAANRVVVYRAAPRTTATAATTSVVRTTGRDRRRPRARGPRDQRPRCSRARSRRP